MNQEEIDYARFQYYAMTEENNKLKSKKQELEKLRHTKEKIKYLSLLRYEQLPLLTDEEIICETFKKIGNKTKNSKKIYIFMGSYGYRKYENKYKLSPLKDAPWTIYNIYKDLETEQEFKIFKERVANFEINNNIIIPRMSNYFLTQELYLKKFYELQIEYYKYLTKTNEKNALFKLKILSIMPPQKIK